MFNLNSGTSKKKKKQVQAQAQMPAMTAVAQTVKPTIGDTAKYFGKSTITGLESGIIQAPNAELQEMELATKKGKKIKTKGDVAKQILNTLSTVSNATNPLNAGNIINYAAKNINDAKELSKVTKKDIKGLGEIAGKSAATLSTLSSLKNPLSAKASIDNIKSLKQSLDRNKTNKALGIANSTISNTADMLGLTGHNLADATYSLVGAADKNADKKIRKVIDTINAPIYKKQEELAKESEKHGKVVNQIAEGLQSMGNMGGSLAAATLTKNPDAAMAFMANSVKGQVTEDTRRRIAYDAGTKAMENAIKQGKSQEEAIRIGNKATEEAINSIETLERSMQRGNTSALAEWATESLSGLGLSKVYGKGVTDDVVKNIIDNYVTNPKLNFALTRVGGVGSEIGEEILSNALNKAIDRGTIDPDAKFTKEDITNTILPTLVSTVGLGGISGDFSRSAYNQNMAMMQQNNVELARAYQNKLDGMNNAERGALTEITIKRKNGIPLDENDMATINYLNSKDTVNDIVDSQRGQNFENNLQLQPQQVQENKFTYEPSDNVKINNFRQSASQFMNDSQQTQDFVNTVEKVINDKNYNITFDNAIGDDVNGRIRMNNGEVEIKINPNSERAGEFILTHEITHAIETKEMSNLIMDYASKDAKFNDLLQSVKESYGTEDITPEVIADISGQALGDEAFITNLSTTKPNIFKTIYNNIISLANKITGNSHEALFVRDLKNKWEKAYREANIETAKENLGNETKLSKEQSKNVKLSKQKLLEDFKNLTGDSKMVADAKIGRYQVQLMQKEAGNFDGEVQAPYSDEAMELFNQIENSRKTSSHLYHSTPADRIQSIVENGLKIGSKQNQEGVSSKDKLYLSATEELARSFAPEDEVTLRIKPNAKLENLDNDLLGGEGAYTITNNIEPKYLQVKENGKWIDLLKSKYAKVENNNTQQNVSTQDNQGRALSKEQQERYKNISDKLKDDNGNIKVYHHGTKRADRVGNVFDPARATSGPMAFFTDNAEIAKGYSESKQDTSISREYDTEYDLFKADNKSLDDYWNSLSKSQQEKINEAGRNIGLDEDFENAIYDKDASKNSFGDQYNYYLRDTKNNGLKALYKLFVEDGNFLFDDMYKFQNVLELAGVKDVEYLDPYKVDSKVYDVYLNIKNPFDTSEISNEMVQKLEKASKTAKTEETYSADMWDKSNRTPESWMEALKDDLKEGTTHAWTSIPDWVTDVLKENGYDGIVDTGGKGGGQAHQVAIPFYSNQIKNIDNLNPTDSDDIRYSKENKQWREYLENKFKNEGKKTYFKDTRMPLADAGTKKGTSNSSFNNETKKPSRFKNLTASDEARLNKIYDIQRKGGKLSQSQIEELEYFKRKEQGLKFPELTKSDQFNKADYAKYYAKANMNKFNSNMLNKAKEIVQPNRQGRRTKQQWLDVAKNIGNQASNMDAESLKRYAYESFKEAQPNQAENLNRQGEKYVKFGVQEWVNAVYDGAGVGTKNIAEKKADSVITVRNKQGQELKLKQDKTNPNVYEREVKVPKDNKSIVPKETMQKQLAKLKDGTKVSNYYSNLTENSKFITQENASKLSQEEIWRYAPQTNKETMVKAEAKIGDTQKSLESAYGDFLSKTENYSPEDVGVGWILLKRFQDAGNYDAMVQVAKKMRTIATKSGQTVQMFNLQSRLTPEGMVKYAQSELMEAEQQFNKGKSQKEIDKYAKDFELTGEEVEFIKSQMEKIQGMEDGRAKNIEMAKINKMLSDKLPHKRGDSIKAWMRISMLFNPKTQVRNVVGNALITPINAIADVPGSIVDKAISKKTGVRTLGAPSLGGLATYGKGFAKGGAEAWQDYKMGINTKDVDMSRFDITQKNPFVTDHKGVASVLNPVSKGLNKANSILDLVMSGGDRVFYQGAFDASLRNQMQLNNVDTPTQDMIDIATQEALSRTWNDNNGYTQFVLNTRRALNKASVGGYGLGDVLIPFAKTPANLTKAIYDYSPVGLASTIFKSKQISNAIETGQITPQMQHNFAQNLGKGVAGTMLYALAYALAKSGIATGSGDDDKDVANFIKNTMGIQPYSIKLGDKTFTYDWAQPIAAPLAIATDAYKNLTKESDENMMARVFDTILDVSNTGINVLMQQSFLQGISEVLNSNEGVANGIMQQVIGLPARAVPTFVQQINNMFDKTQRVAFEKDQPLKTGKQNVMSKLPGQSKKLAPRVDTLGNEVQRYGDSDSEISYALKNFLSPANQSNRKPSKAADEIYDVYKATGDKTIMPMVAPYYIQNKTVGRIDLDSKDRATYQKISGKLVNEAVEELSNDSTYKNLSYDEKAEVLNGVVSYANAKAKEHFTGFMANTYNPANKKINNGMSIADYYLEKTKNKR